MHTLAHSQMMHAPKDKDTKERGEIKSGVSTGDWWSADRSRMREVSQLV